MLADVDYALVGGGLQNGLIALALRALRPAARIALIERAPALGGNHTWCFHAGDLDDARAAWVAPLVVARWPGYDVAFPAHRRRLASPYACVTSARLAQVVARALDAPGSRLVLGATATEVGADRVVYGIGDRAHAVAARVVIDARGPDAGQPGPCGWQKFVGRELVLERPHGLTHPVVMDATVPQLDGLRFLYVLPLDGVRLLVEDTYFSDTAALDAGALRARIAAYADRQGWTVAHVAREEAGALPLPWRPAPPSPRAPLVAGYAGGWFHPVTGYSFPIASRLAQRIATCEPDALFGRALDDHARAHAQQLRFAGRLVRMLFHWFAPAERYRVLERFYRLPEDVIRRFYALALTPLDRARILVGRPPRGLSLRGVLGRGSS